MQAAHPKKIYIELTTRCNLNCRKCVKYSQGAEISEQNMDITTFKNLLPSMTRADTVVLNGIGEPLLHPYLVDFIALTRMELSQHATIGFQSNGLLLTNPLAKKLINAGLDTICLSVDSMHENPAEKEQSLEAVSIAADIINVVRKDCNQQFTIGAGIVLKKETIHDLPRIIAWAAENCIDYIIATHLIPYEQSLENDALFVSSPHLATTLINTYIDIAAEQGVNLRESYPIYKRYAGTRTEKATLEILSSLQKEAKKLDISLNLEELLLHKSNTVELIGDVFTKARKLAREKGINLRLPSIQALNSHERCCPFINEKAVFVSVDGDVMPCHFLWHTYPCQVNRENIQIRKRVYGNVNSIALEAIWQKSEYQVFRKEAASSAYAPCMSCPLSPCPSLVNDNLSYAHDCYGSAVPCGHCHWNLGGFQCL